MTKKICIALIKSLAAALLVFVVCYTSSIFIITVEEWKISSAWNVATWTSFGRGFIATLMTVAFFGMLMYEGYRSIR